MFIWSKKYEYVCFKLLSLFITKKVIKEKMNTLETNIILKFFMNKIIKTIPKKNKSIGILFPAKNIAKKWKTITNTTRFNSIFKITKW